MTTTSAPVKVVNQEKRDAPVTSHYAKPKRFGIERLLTKTLMHFIDEQSERERVLTDDVISPNVKYISSRSAVPYIHESPNKSTAISCYEFGASDLKVRFGNMYGQRSGSGICIFERLCWSVAQWRSDGRKAMYQKTIHTCMKKQKEKISIGHHVSHNTKVHSEKLGKTKIYSMQWQGRRPNVFDCT